MKTLPKNNNKLINGWAMYDWANSVYSLTIVSAIFPIYYDNATKQADGSTVVEFLGWHLENTALYTFALSFSFLLFAVLSPVLSGIADYRGNKRHFMQFFCVMGSLACTGLYFFTGSNLTTGIALVIIASLGFTGSIVFYNSYLPEIADPDKQDNVSARGFALGYIGSVLLLIVNLLMVMKPGLFHLKTAGEASRISFVTVGIWWFGFAQITFYVLRRFDAQRTPSPATIHAARSIWGGYGELQKVWAQVKHLPRLRWFLVSFFFYSMGVQTVMYVASLFGDKELHLESSQLIITILIIQLVAIGGAYFMSMLSKKKGNIFTIGLCLIIWMFICVYAYFIHTGNEFFVAAFLVGLVMGGVQSISRSTYSKLLPHTGDTASFFSFYDVAELSIVLGTFSYGLIEQLTGSMRNSLFALITFFIIGFIFLGQVKMPKDAEQATA